MVAAAEVGSVVALKVVDQDLGTAVAVEVVEEGPLGVQVERHPQDCEGRI